MVVFKVNDVKPNLESLRYWLPGAANGAEQAKALAGNKAVEGFSHPDAAFVQGEPLGTKNPLLAAVYLAFNLHLPLILTPDMVWNTIMQGVSEHVGKDPEKHRHAFVSHQDKEVLTVRIDQFRKGSGNDDWGSVALQFVELISKKLSGKAAIRALNTRFSTTDAMASVAHAIVFMDAVKSYFEFRCTTLCGIPSIELLGTRQDWQHLRTALALLDDLDLSAWRSELDPILGHFEDAFDKRVDQSFWNNIFLYHGAFGSGGITTVSGWISKFFLYTTNGLNPNAISKAAMRLDPVDFPSGLSETPFVWEYFSSEYQMLLRGGLIGVVVDAATHSVAPQLGWLVTEAEDMPPDLAKDEEYFKYSNGF